MSKSKIKQDPKNARLHSEVNKEHINKSLKDLGAGRSVVIDNEDYLIAGNGVYEQAEKLGLKTKVIESDGTELVVIKRTDLNYEDEKRRKLAIADNATSESSEWNFEELTDDEIEEWGIEEHQEEEIQLEAKEDDFVEEVPKIPISVLGDLYEIGEHRLLCGDSTDSDELAKLMNGEKADVSFTSPPYNAGKSELLSGNTHSGDNKYDSYDDNQDKDDYLDLLISFTNNALLNSQYLICNIQSLAGNKIALIQYLHQFKDNFIDVAIWDKGNGAPAMAENVMTSAWEYLLFISSKDKATRAIPNGNFRGNVLNIHRDKPQRNNEFSKVHAATFPIHLPEWAMQFTKKEQIILDQFLGTGTTMVAAHQLERKCYGMELDPKYCDVIVKRMLNLDSKLTIKRNGIDCTKDFKTA